MIKNKYKNSIRVRGHLLEYANNGNENKFRYCTDKSLYISGEKEKPCIKCGKPAIPYKSNMGYGLDACWGKLPGVIAACCGHGLNNIEAYVKLKDKTIIRFKPNTTKKEVLKALEKYETSNCIT